MPPPFLPPYGLFRKREGSLDLVEYTLHDAYLSPIGVEEMTTLLAGAAVQDANRPTWRAGTETGFVFVRPEEGDLIMCMMRDVLEQNRQEVHHAPESDTRS